uniref:Fucose-1-phosphate guanylyltransferase-like n=1 Tax=Phallusia mammillata TaxID=59560 RepID=A0A6F9DDX6_9ASCI|nr:fucose-1-phosphate guanylyltransferase-like [Phallusia mammillata]
MIFESKGETRQRLRRFDNIRGKKETNHTFWDVVVVTAADEPQKNAFQKQIEQKLKSKELPTFSSYLVICDPPGYKIGNGGATMLVLEELYSKYGESVYKMKTIVIHAGGYSQRLPTASVLGKVFTAFPTREPILQMLELKLASYIDFPGKIESGGVFVCCADTVEVYNDLGKPWKFHPSGITGLGHPSSIEIGTTHGVYLLNSLHSGSITAECKQFLHKPSAKKMYATNGCVQKTALGEDIVITDSAFYMAPDVCRKLLKFYCDNKPLTCEIDAYGDFLQALGTDSDDSYITNTANVVRETSSLLYLRRKVFDTLRGTTLHVVALIPRVGETSDVSSHFYHFGTSREYLDVMTKERVLSEITDSELVSHCAGLPYKYTPAGDKPLVENPPRLMASVILPCVSIGEGSTLEYCHLREFTAIGANSIVSSCSLFPSTTVPPDTILHTVAINSHHAGELQFVTIAFGIADNMKASTLWDNALSEIKYYGNLLENTFSDASRAFPNTAKDDKVSLWHAKIFPAFPTMEKSSSQACERLNVILKNRGNAAKCKLSEEPDQVLYSMADILLCKNVDRMLEFRSKLKSQIQATRHDQSALSSLYSS